MNHKGKNNHGMRHMIMMTLACVIPLAIIFILPFFGISNKWTNIGAIGLMIFLHVLMMREHFLDNHKKHKGVQSELLSKSK